MAFYCEKCAKEARQLFKLGGFKLCENCYKPEKEIKRKEFDDFYESQKQIKAIAEPKVSKPLDPQKYPVRNWIKELIFRDEKIHKAKLIGEMEEKGYKPGTVKSQMKRIERDYVVTNDFIFLNKEVQSKEGVKV